NKDLFAMVSKGEFREDLYYRLDVLKLNIPSLNERRDDIPLIFEDFMRMNAHLSEFKNISITEEAKQLLQEFDWPGNVRELGNICERLIVFSQSPVIDERAVKEILVHKGSNDTMSMGNITEDRGNLEVRRIKEAIELEGYCKTKAAKRLGIHRTTLLRRMKDLKMI
ncbi:MAG: sigma-54-dependent Fis family transcriptional regulator, partial [Clostridia bacterium]|nr:sigma-54-dependent Fis family transcriptional regulator [Clostridia bacterium]